jgi:nucleoid DNA-binding protein
MSKSAQGKPLQDAVHRAAQEMGVSDHFAANLMTYWLEEVAAQVDRGKVVRIPGFGIFTAYGYTPRKKGIPPYCLPSFVGAKPWRNELRQCLPFRRHNNKAIDNYRQTNHGTSRAKSDTSRVFTTMKAFRERIDAQAKRLGVKSRPTGIVPT